MGHSPTRSRRVNPILASVSVDAGAIRCRDRVLPRSACQERCWPHRTALGRHAPRPAANQRRTNATQGPSSPRVALSIRTSSVSRPVLVILHRCSRRFLARTPPTMRPWLHDSRPPLRPSTGRRRAAMRLAASKLQEGHPQKSSTNHSDNAARWKESWRGVAAARRTIGNRRACLATVISWD